MAIFANEDEIKWQFKSIKQILNQFQWPLVEAFQKIEKKILKENSNSISAVNAHYIFFLNNIKLKQKLEEN